MVGNGFPGMPELQTDNFWNQKDVRNSERSKNVAWFCYETIFMWNNISGFLDLAVYGLK